jgi:hypothetical protein
MFVAEPYEVRRTEILESIKASAIQIYHFKKI